MQIWSLQLFSGMSEQDLLFSDFPDEPGDLEEGAEYNKVSNET